MSHLLTILQFSGEREKNYMMFVVVYALRGVQNLLSIDSRQLSFRAPKMLHTHLRNIFDSFLLPSQDPHEVTGHPQSYNAFAFAKNDTAYYSGVARRTNNDDSSHKALA